MPHQDDHARLAALAVLGLPGTATARQITAAYRRLARTTHPDVTGRTGANAAARFAEITAAYQRLAPGARPSALPSPDGPSHRRRSSKPRGPRYIWVPETPWPDPPLAAGPVVITPCPDTPGPDREGHHEH